jgi:tetratricopeptide (TPR) repeat protein
MAFGDGDFVKSTIIFVAAPVAQGRIKLTFFFARRCARIFTRVVPPLLFAIVSLHGAARAFAQQSTSSEPLQVIVVSSEAEAEKVRAELLAGADFAALARDKSTDPTATHGGFMGVVDPASLRPDLREALREVAPGGLTPIVHLPSGYAILKVMTEAPRESRQAAAPETPRSNMGSSGGTQLQAMSAEGLMRNTTDVSGLNEAEAALAGFAKPDHWEQDPLEICKMRNDSFAHAKSQLEKFLAGDSSVMPAGAPGGGLKAYDRIEAIFGLGQLAAYQGDMNAAIEQYEKAAKLAEQNLPDAIPVFDETLGVAYLHRSEMENGVYRDPGERCIFPIASRDKYAKTGDSARAIQYFLHYLKQKPDDLEVRWLLNIANMTMGTYPAGVPKEYLFDPKLFQSAEEVGRFRDVAPAAGVNTFSMAGGVIVDDFDNDGLLDIVSSSMDMCQALHFFHNNGDGTFSERAKQAGLSDQLGGLNIIQADYNNDGCTDILVLRGGWELPQRKSLLKNNCDGTFTDVTKAAGLAEPATSSQTAVWTDINNDGLLDLFVGNENGPSQLFLNNGDGTFKDISHAAGVDGISYAKGVAAGDYDNDGWPDLYVSNFQGENLLYHNNHNNTFTEVAHDAGVPGNGRGFAAFFFDYDNDGWPDIFVTSYFTSVDETARTYLGMPHNVTSLKLYRNLGNGTFHDVTREVGLNKVFMPMGGNFGDFDNDGFLDIYLGTGNPSYASLVPNVLLKNVDGKKFEDVTASSGTGELHKGHGVAFADMENNGKVDIVTEIGGATPGDRHAFRLFENPGNDNDWITVKLVGVKTNRSAIGARIHVTVENAGAGPREIYRTVGSGGSFGASPLEQEIGLGKSAKITNIEIWWPTSNTRQNFANVVANQFIEIKEFEKNFTKLERKPYHLGGPPAPK